MIKPDPTPPPTKRPSPASSQQRRWLPLIPVLGGMLSLLIAVVVIIVFVVARLFGGRTDPGMPAPVVKLTPTPFVSPTPIPSCGPVIISSGDVQVAAAIPISLTVAGEPFPIVTAAPEQGGWTYPADGSGSAIWICGMVVNYVVGLEPTAENEALLAGLKPGDEVKLHLSNSTMLFFRFVERRETETNDASVFEQSRPRLTLILEKEAGGWQVATADYATETAPVQPPSATLAQPGQPVRLDDMELTVATGHAEHGGLDHLPGTMYYLVEFSVQNLGETALDADVFNMQLQDNAGNVYLPSPAASAVGEHGALSGQIDPGETAQGTAGYLVPEALPGPTLIWTIRPWPGSELRASVSIPHETSVPEPPPAGRAVVTITDAFLDEDVLLIEGEVRNTGTGPLTLEVKNITLSSSAGMSSLLVAAPPLPWTIEPGQTQVIELKYDKPDASTVLLSLAGYSFEIGNLE